MKYFSACVRVISSFFKKTKIEGLNAAAENHPDNEPNHEEILENGESHISASQSIDWMMINANYE